MAVMRRQGSLAVVSLTACVIGVAGHGSLNTPPARNSIDRFLPEFINGKAPTGSCSCNCGSDEKGCDAGIRQSGGGQSCLWFSQGCSIGCKTCTGIGSHSAVRLCNDSTLEPTLPKWAWSMNRWAVEGTSNDSYRYSPWRAPGTAPVMDACGQAGGTYPWHGGPGVAVFANTSFARFGDLGSHVLPPAPSGAIWKAGSSVEVTWGIRFNHGGGYSYRCVIIIHISRFPRPLASLSLVADQGSPCVDNNHRIIAGSARRAKHPPRSASRGCRSSLTAPSKRSSSTMGRATRSWAPLSRRAPIQRAPSGR